ncbi:hypothetical protein HY522_02180 [bacterium]|nr:hypothetical protein [bacterium]
MLCLLAAPGWGVVNCGAAGQASIDSGLGSLAGDTMDLKAAYGYFSTAIALDGANCSAAYVARALVTVALLYDTDMVKALRKGFGDTTDYSLLSRDTTPHGDHKYTWVADTMDADDFQGAMGGPVLTGLNAALADFQAAENGSDTTWELPVPRRFFGYDTDAEVDYSDVFFFQGAIWTAKAVIQMATAYNANVGRDWREFKSPKNNVEDTPDEDTFIRHVENNTSFLTLRTAGHDSFTTAAGYLQTADTKLLKFFQLTQAETNTDALQDTDLFAYKPNGKFNQHLADFVDDTDVEQYTEYHNDTNVKSFAGGNLNIQLEKENADLGTFVIRPKSFFETPETRVLIPSSSAGRHGFEFGESFFPDPTFQGLAPGMTNNDLFIISQGVDTYFVVTSMPATIDLNQIFGTTVKKKVDVKFNVGGSGGVTIVRGNSSAGVHNVICTFLVTPIVSTPSHLRIFYNRDFDFNSTEAGLLSKEKDTTLVYAVAWAVSGGHVVDAGRTGSAFSSYYNTAATNQIKQEWRDAADDTFMLFRFGSDADATAFKSLGASATVTKLSAQTLLSANIDRFGWFVIGETAPLIQVVDGARYGLRGDGTVGSFKIKVVNEYGAGIPNAAVSFTTFSKPSGATDGTVSSSGTTNATGEATASFQLGDKDGVYVIKAISNGAIGFLYAFTIGYTPFDGSLWRMISMPQYPAASFSAPSPSETAVYGRLGPSASAADFIGDDFSSYKLYLWDPSQTTSEAGFSDAGHQHYISQSTVRMGRAYWLKTTTTGTLDAVGGNDSTVHAHTDAVAPETIYVPLQVGWNQIGVPYDFSITRRDLLVDTGMAPSNANPVPIDSVAATGHLKVIYWISPTNTADPGIGSSGYSQGGPGTTRPDIALFPFRGYWIQAATTCTIVYPPHGSGPAGGDLADGGGSSAGAPPYILLSAPGLSGQADNWTLQLYATGATGVDYENFAGIRPTADAAAASYAEPPILPGGVGLSFVESGKRYGQLLKTAGADPAWSVEIQSAAAGPVTVKAANIASLPAGAPVTLRDESTGEVMDLRAGGYTYESGADEVREFTFAAATLESRPLAKIKLPMACVLARTVDDPDVVNAFRRVRDFLLRSGLGRAAVVLYYSAFSL